MIKPKVIRKHLDKRHFESFRILMTDGAIFNVTNPELCLVSRSTFLVGRNDARRLGVANGVDYCALLAIERLEPLKSVGRRKGER